LLHENCENPFPPDLVLSDNSKSHTTPNPLEVPIPHSNPVLENSESTNVIDNGSSVVTDTEVCEIPDPGYGINPFDLKIFNYLREHGPDVKPSIADNSVTTSFHGPGRVHLFIY
jgi:hypothetical protein